jgi:hypothetical protein
VRHLAPDERIGAQLQGFPQVRAHGTWAGCLLRFARGAVSSGDDEPGSGTAPAVGRPRAEGWPLDGSDDAVHCTRKSERAR